MLSFQSAASRRCRRNVKIPFLTGINRVMSQVFIVVAAGSVLSFIIHELGEPATASWIIQVQNLLWLLRHILTSTGPIAGAGGAVASRRSTFRCSGPETLRCNSASRRLRGKRCLRQSRLDGYARWRRSPPWIDSRHASSGAIHSSRDPATEASYLGQCLCKRRRLGRWSVGRIIQFSYLI